MLLLLALVNTLTCHCAGSTTCSANGYCSSGCNDGWSGPGCQVGNVALNKSAYQSTTYIDPAYYLNASLAVDGVVPLPPLPSAQFCSHTDLNQPSAWWYVTLSTTHDYIITNVTLVNRNDTKASNNERLRDFVILYSNEVIGNPDPNNTIWKECARQSGTIGYSRTYACKSRAIAKRVAVYLLNSTDPILTLCEVKVFGYQMDDCPNGFTGPGCLLRTCDDQCIATGGTCDGEYGSCRYDVCPDRSLLPPECWITLSNYSAVQVKSISTCDTVEFYAVMKYPQPNIAASMLLLRLGNSSNGMTVVNITMPVLNTIFYSYNNASPGATYDVSVTPIYCNIAEFPCFYSTGSKVFTSVIGKRDYWLSNNQSCFFVHVNSSTAYCELPTTLEIRCKNTYTSELSANSSGSIACGIEKGQEYECLVTAKIDATANRFEIRTFVPTFMTKTLTEALPSEKKAGIVAGSIVGAVVVISIICIAVVYSRRQRTAETNRPGSNKGSTVVLNEKTMPSPGSASHSVEEQYDNFYNSLDKGSTMESAGDYAELKQRLE